MKHDQIPPLWSTNRASVLIEALDIAAKADQAKTTQRPSAPIFEGIRARLRTAAIEQFARPAFDTPVTVRHAAIMVGLVAISAILAAGWIA